MNDYIQIYQEYSSNTIFTIPNKELVNLIIMGILIFIVAMLALRSIIEEKGERILFSLLVEVAFCFLYIQLIVSVDNSKNLENVKKYNVNSIKKLGENIETVKKELGIIENKEQETNRILNRFYKSDKNLSLDEEKIAAEMLYDGIYAISTNLEDDIENIIRVGQRRWEIEESFRIMKSEFKSRPVYLSRKDRIEAHFMTCFLALTLYRVLEHKLEHQFTCPQILKTLREFNFNHHYGIGYVPTFSRNEITDKLRDVFQIETDFEIISEKNMKNIFKITKK